METNTEIDNTEIDEQVQNPTKPITIVIEELKKDIVDDINKSQLHPFIIDSVIKDMYNEIHLSYLKQVEFEKQEYEKSINK